MSKDIATRNSFVPSGRIRSVPGCWYDSISLKTDIFTLERFYGIKFFFKWTKLLLYVTQFKFT